MTDTPDLRRPSWGPDGHKATCHIYVGGPCSCGWLVEIERRRLARKSSLPELLEKAPPQCSGPFSDARDCPVHAKDVTGAQPEPDLNALIADLRRHYDSDWDTTVPGKEFDAEIGRIVRRHLRAGSSPAPSPPSFKSALEAIANDPISGKETLAAAANWYRSIAKRALEGVTGNEGKDEQRREDNHIGVPDSDPPANDGDSGQTQPPAPLASPAAVTPEQFFEKEISSGNVDRSSLAEYIRKQMFDFAEKFAASKVAEFRDNDYRDETIKALSESHDNWVAKVSELEAQLQQAQANLREAQSDAVFFEQRAADAMRWKQLEAELERMRAGGKQ